MKISEYPQIVELAKDQVLLISGPNGTKKILTKDMIDSLFKMVDPDVAYNIIQASMRQHTMFPNAFVRGKNLGSFNKEHLRYLNPENCDEAHPQYSGIYVGDYWEDGDNEWRIADIDYWYGQGDQPCDEHHIVVMPDRKLYNEKMNNESSTTNGYMGSTMYKTGLTNAKSIIISIFSADCILNHREYLINGVVDGRPSAGMWVDSTTEIPNEVMMYGSFIFEAFGTRYLMDKTQLSLMMIDAFFINPHRQTNWLRDIVSVNNFASVYGYGIAGAISASSSNGVRPVTGIKYAS